MAPFAGAGVVPLVANGAAAQLNRRSSRANHVLTDSTDHHNCQISRRTLLSVAGMTLSLPAAAADPAAEVQKDLQASVVSNPGTSWAVTNKQRQVYYPAAFEGTWQVSARLKSVAFPQGQSFMDRNVPGVTKASMVAALPDVGAGADAAVVYQCRFIPSAEGVVADRIFNQTALLDAFLGYRATQSVDYDAEKEPTRMAVVYTTPRKNDVQGGVDVRKAELFINNRRAAQSGESFYMSEFYRQVNQAKQSGYVYDYETIVHYRQTGENMMQADMRVAAFLIPSAPSYFQSGGRSVVHYDYALDLHRV